MMFMDYSNGTVRKWRKKRKRKKKIERRKFTLGTIFLVVEVLGPGVYRSSISLTKADVTKPDCLL